jgi:hypothetical protein
MYTFLPLYFHFVLIKHFQGKNVVPYFCTTFIRILRNSFVDITLVLLDTCIFGSVDQYSHMIGRE